MSDKHVIKLTIRDSQEIVFDGEVDRVSSYNEVGSFDVYPMHANFISILRKQIDLYSNHKKIKEIKIEQAIMKIKKDVMTIYLGIEALTLDEDSLETSETGKDINPKENKK